LEATFKINELLYTVDLSKPLDISIPLEASKNNPLAWYLDAPKIEPVKLDNWVAKVNPHAHGTHTECVGHISEKFYSVNEVLKEFFFLSEVISVIPETLGKDEVITGIQIKSLLAGKRPEALIIRTLPNSSSKRSRKYSHTNWPYLTEDAAQYMHDLGIKHLLIDLPSVDKEKDDGALLAHKAFWNYPKEPRLDATITEFIYVPNKIKDGSYLLNLQVNLYCTSFYSKVPFLSDSSTVYFYVLNKI